MKKRLLLTGGSGFLGWNIMNLEQDDWEITGTYNNRKPPHADAAGMIQVDLSDLKTFKPLIEQVQPNGIIFSAANRVPNYCQQHPKETQVINVKAPVLMAKLAAERNIPFVFTSTDLVFDGTRGNYKETDPVNPVSVYGEQKVRAEEGILKAYPNAAVCRMPLMFGYPGPNSFTFIQEFIKMLQTGDELKLFHDEYRSAIGGVSAAKGLLLALDNFHGIYHLGGREPLSRLDFGKLLKEVFEIDNAKMVGISQKELKMAAPRPADVTLDSSKAYAKGFDPMNSRDELMWVREANKRQDAGNSTKLRSVS